MKDGNQNSFYEEDSTNKYNQNFYNRFCGCECDYDAENQKGTMYQCLGLGSADTGGCGEDWWHASCIVGLDPNWNENGGCEEIQQILENIKQSNSSSDTAQTNNSQQSTGKQSITAQIQEAGTNHKEVDLLSKLGFPADDDFEGFICYKCVDAYPWIKYYAGTPGFLPAVYRRDFSKTSKIGLNEVSSVQRLNTKMKKRKASEIDIIESTSTPRLMETGSTEETPPLEAIKVSDRSLDVEPISGTMEMPRKCKRMKIIPPESGQFSLFFKEDFRIHFCRCNDCFVELQSHPQLLELEESYEPSVSTNYCEEPNSNAGSGNLYDRGESVLMNIDRVKAIEGVMAYNHLKDKLKPFFQQFAESGKTISAEDIKAHFAKIRGDELGVNVHNTGQWSKDRPE